ncbi:MAG TPA: hypothetical protein VNO75_08610 [Gemmatimonadaceae bacterium]|nr:hypothetical protein [Gemmatimonadaceae bacterium]
MLGLSHSTILSLVWLAVVLAVLLSFFRGMRTLEQIAARLERIEHILAKWPPSGPNQSASHIAT